jgi:hypothetical protein
MQTKTILLLTIIISTLLTANAFTSVHLSAQTNSNNINSSSKATAVGTNQGVETRLSNTTFPGNYTDSFMLKNCNFSTTGSNPYFILQPGYRTVFTGVEDNVPFNTTFTVLNQTKVVGVGIVARVVQDKVANSQTGDLKEITYDYFAICKQTNSVFYFGEHVDDYENGKIVGHKGSWQHGVNNSRAGLFMPGIVLLGSRYYQEIAPGIALDRAEIVGMNQTISVPAGNFNNVIKIKETNALEPKVTEDNLYTPRVGLVFDHNSKLVSYGYLK